MSEENNEQSEWMKMIEKNGSFLGYEQAPSNSTFAYEKDIDSYIKGTMSELLVMKDLLSKGYEIFTHLTTVPKTKFDVVAYKSSIHKIIRIEVTTGWIDNDTGKRGYPYHSYSREHWDIIAVVYKDGIKYYQNPENMLYGYPEITDMV